jgi:undecaprenyl-diphosphatase
MPLQFYDLDASMTHAINGLAGAGGIADFLMIWMSAIGVPLLVLAVAGQWWQGPDRPHNRHILVAAGLTFLLGLALNQLILLFVHRMRPYDAGISHLLVAPSADPSFPSDHATASFAIAAAFLVHGMRRVGLWFLVAAVLVAFSRVYIGTHYVSDVLGGAATGLAAALLVRALYREGTRIDRLVTGIL